MKTFQNEEAYICIYSKRDHDAILFTHEGGIDIGNVEEKAKTLILPVGGEGLNSDSIKATLLTGLDSSKHERVSKFIMALYEVYKRQYFTYMEINPLVITDKSIFILDFAAKVMFKICVYHYINFTEYFEKEILVYSFISFEIIVGFSCRLHFPSGKGQFGIPTTFWKGCYSGRG